MLDLKNIYKTYRSKNGVTHRALNNVSLSFGETGLVFIVGKSGGGKSTLLNVIGALDKPDRGEMSLYNNSFSSFSNADYDSYRNTFVGVIYQEYNLIKTLTVYENIALSLGLQGEKAKDKVNEVIEMLDLTSISHRRPNQISGGQSQRVAIARAIVKDPKLILADEPTGNLDSKTGREMFDIFKKLSRDRLVIIVTHDRSIADEIGDRVIEVKDGKIHKDIVRSENLYEKSVDLVGDKLIRVPKGKKFDQDTLEDVNGILASLDRDVYVINESDVLKVKSMNTHVKNAVEIVPGENTSYYFPYKHPGTESRQIKLKKATMPFSVGLKLSVSMLKHKTFRLILTVIMLLISLTISCFVTSMDFYDTERAIAKTISAGENSIVTAVKNTEYYANSEFSQDEIDKFAASGYDPVGYMYSGYIYPEYIGMSSYCKDLLNGDFRSSYPGFFGYVEIEDLTNTDLECAAGALDIQSPDGAVISSVAADYLLHIRMFEGVNDYSGLIGKKMVFSGRETVISGIFKSKAYDHGYISDLLESTASADIIQYASSQYRYVDELNTYLDSLLTLDGYVFVQRGFVSSVIKDGESIAIQLEMFSDPAQIIPPATGFPVNKAVKLSTAPAPYITFDGAKEDGIYISKSLAAVLAQSSEDAAITEYFNKFNNSSMPCNLVITSVSGVKYIAAVYNDLDIKGIIDDGTYSGNIYIEDACLEDIITANAKIDGLMFAAPSGVRRCEALYSLILGCTSTVKNSFVSDYGDTRDVYAYISSFLKSLLFVTSLLSVILMYSFISSTIKVESRQIGILRGMGARGIDTFKAFGIEGAIIAIFSVIVTAIAVSVLFPLLNGLISAVGYGYMHYFFLLNPMVVLALILTATVITAVSIILPLIRLVRRTPVEASNLNEVQR